MKKLVFLLMGCGPGGIELQIPNIVNNLKDMEPIVYVIHGLRTNANNNIFAGTEINTNLGARRLPQSAFSLYRFARKNKDMIFHGFNIGPIFLMVLKIARVKKIIYGIRGTIYWRNGIQKLVFGLFWKMALSDKIKLISNSDYSARKFKELIWPQAKITKIYNAIDTERFYFKRSNYTVVPKKIIYVGRLAKGKNLYLWLDIAKLIGEYYLQTEFHIFGDGSLRNELKNYTQNIRVEGKVTFHGYIKDVEQAYKFGDLMIFLSDHESFGNVVVESIIAGTPVICSAIPSFQEIFKNYPEFLVNLDDNTADLVLQKISAYKDLTELTIKAQAEFVSLFNIENHIRQLRQIYNDF